MRWRLHLTIGAICAGSVLFACQQTRENSPPPDARRPVIKTHDELAAERAAQIAAGEAVPTTSPARLPAETARGPARRVPPAVIRPTPGAIEAEALLVNDDVITVAEVLYPILPHIAKMRETQTPEGFIESLQTLLHVRTQQAVGSLLIHKQAVAGLSEQQKKIVDEGVEREYQETISQDFGGSAARFERNLTDCGLTVKQYRTLLERDMVAREYVREKMLPMVSITRNEILSYYRLNRARYSTAETRELALIEAPFEAFLPPEVAWERAPEAVRAQARLKASRHIRAAAEALVERPFEDVAREYSRDVHAAHGGVWGEITRPLQPPYDELSKLIFGFQEGQTSEPIETERGWYIVRCSKITPARNPAFTDVQEQIRETLSEEKFQRLSAEYMNKLASKATMSSLEAFLNSAVRRVIQDQARLKSED
jgi:parvulin-like peptidyl-prolyl isomerase